MFDISPYIRFIRKYFGNADYNNNLLELTRGNRFRDDWIEHRQEA